MPFCVDFHVPIMVNNYTTVQMFGVALKKNIYIYFYCAMMH